MAFESNFKSIEDYYIGVLATLAGLLLVAGVAITLWGYRKQQLEVGRGYMPSRRIAAQDPRCS